MRRGGLARVLPVLLASLLPPSPAVAAGIDDLRAALARLPGRTTIAAELAITTRTRSGADDGAGQERHGAAALVVTDGADGLALRIAPDVLARSEAERTAATTGGDAAATPTLDALRGIDIAGVHALVSAAPALERQLAQASFVEEAADTLDGRAVRRLAFTFGTDGLRPRERRFVREFSGELDVWIDDDGVPLASTLRQRSAGRAFVVISFAAELVEESTYRRAGDRLVVVRQETRSDGSGAGERNAVTTTRTLSLQ
jgi:hypothetical protein